MSAPRSGAVAAAHAPLLEVRLHRPSPFGPVLNGVIIVALLYGAYVAISLQTGQDLLETRGDQVAVNPGAWAAFVLSLVFAAAISIPARSHAQWRASLADLRETLDEDGRALAEVMTIGPPRRRVTGAVIAFALGAAGGLVFVYWLLMSSGLDLETFLRSTGAWFLITQPVLFGLAARAGVQLRHDDQDMAALVRDHLVVDLARLDRLEVYGRLALRSALSWLVMAAIILLFFVFAAPVAVSISALVLSLLAGAYAFASTVGPVVQRVSRARDARLADIREQIAAAGDMLAAGQAAPGTPISELAAYEAWLEKRPVWPISAPVSRRLALYGFIPVLAWFGAAAAELLLGRLA